MITNTAPTYKRLLIAEYTIESGDISGYAADQVSIPIDTATIASPSTPTNRNFTGIHQVRSSSGVEKTGFKLDYSKVTGYARVIESTGTFSTGDIVTVIGNLHL